MSKHRPVNRDEFIALCMRNLGDGVIQINVSEDQVEDRVEEALKFYTDYHYDGTENAYFPHVVTAEEADTGVIQLPDSMVGVTNVYSKNGNSFSQSIASIPGGYQFLTEMAFNMTSGGLASYYMNSSYYETLNIVLNGMTSIRFNRHTNHVHIDSRNWVLTEGDVIVVDGWEIVDPDIYNDIWNDRWLISYATALIKKTWGANLSKFAALSLPGSVQFNGDKIFDDAITEIQQLEDSIPKMRPRDLIA